MNERLRPHNAVFIECREPLDVQRTSNGRRQMSSRLKVDLSMTVGVCGGCGSIKTGGRRQVATADLGLPRAAAQNKWGELRLLIIFAGMRSGASGSNARPVAAGSLLFHVLRCSMRRIRCRQGRLLSLSCPMRKPYLRPPPACSLARSQEVLVLPQLTSSKCKHGAA
jgi:hypothetical protein